MKMLSRRQNADAVPFTISFDDIIIIVYNEYTKV